MYPFSIIRKDSVFPIAKNFKENEFYTKCEDYQSRYHLFDVRLIAAIQACRDFAQSAIFITSTFRTPKCNTVQGGAKNSWHLKGMAVDFYCPEYHEKLVDQLISKGPLFSALRKSGINGFGISDRFIHLDTRPMKGGKFELWYY